MAVLNLNEQSFQKEVLDYKGVVLIDFWAPWCGPCQIMGPVVDKLEEAYRGKIKTVKVNIDENQSLASRFGVMSIPTVIIFENGELVEQMVGVQSEEVLKSKIDPLLKQKND